MIAFRTTRTKPIGLHVGPHTATLAQLAGPDDQREIHVMASVDLPADEALSPQEQDHAVAAVLRKAIADHRFKGRQVVSCLGSQELFVQNVRLPQLPPDEVAKVVRWEAEERLPYPAAEAEIRHILAGQVRHDTNLKQEVILMACHHGVLQRHIAILEAAGLDPVAVDVEPCAVVRCFQGHASPDAAPTARQAYLHLGERATTVIFAEGDQILFLKHVASGGHHWDVAVSRHLELTVPEAARMRSVVTASKNLDADDEIHRSVIDAIRNPLEAMATEVELCLRYYKVTFRGKPLEKIVVTGCEANPWLVEFLTRRLGSPCQLGNPFTHIAHWPGRDDATECPGRWTTAIGLSMH